MQEALQFLTETKKYSKNLNHISSIIIAGRLLSFYNFIDIFCTIYLSAGVGTNDFAFNIPMRNILRVIWTSDLT